MTCQIVFIGFCSPGNQQCQFLASLWLNPSDGLRRKQTIVVTTIGIESRRDLLLVSMLEGLMSAREWMFKQTFTFTPIGNNLQRLLLLASVLDSGATDQTFKHTLAFTRIGK